MNNHRLRKYSKLKLLHLLKDQNASETLEDILSQIESMSNSKIRDFRIKNPHNKGYNVAHDRYVDQDILKIEYKSLKSKFPSKSFMELIESKEITKVESEYPLKLISLFTQKYPISLKGNSKKEDLWFDSKGQYETFITDYFPQENLYFDKILERKQFYLTNLKESLYKNFRTSRK